jgi:neutral amino acid transport system substrate-binding protein
VKIAKDAGAKSLAVVYEDGNYGETLSAAVSASAKAGGLDPVTLAGFKAGEARKSAAAARDAAPDAVVVAARDGAQGVIAELANAGVRGNKLILADGAFVQYGAALSSRALEGARALVPGAFPSAHFQAELVAIDAGLKDMTFAAQTYDAVNLAALAAGAAEDDGGTSIAGMLVAVSGGTSGSRASAPRSGRPSPCTTYKDCLAAIRDGKAIDYDGESGPVRFDANGDVTAAKFMVFTYGADNKAKLTGSEAAARSAG